MMSNKIMNIKYNISLNRYQISILQKEIEELYNLRKMYLTIIENAVVSNHYINICYCCNRNIDSNKSDFCIECGWYKCDKFKSCGCTYAIKRINKKYKRILETDIYIRSLKEKIEKIDYNIKVSNIQCKIMKEDNMLFKEELSKFVSILEKNETKSKALNKKLRLLFRIKR